MNLRVLSLFSLILVPAVAGHHAYAEESARPARGPIVYDSHWQVHHVDPGVRMPGDEPDERSRLRSTPRTPGGLREDVALPQSVAPTYLPPPQITRPPEDARRRNWIVPTLEDDESPLRRPRAEEDEEPSGWGWLADEIGQRQRERDLEMDEEVERREEADANWFLQRDPVRTGLISDEILVTTPLLFGVSTGGEDEADGERARRTGAAAEMTLEERVRNSGEDRSAMEPEDAYGRVDPWGLDQVHGSAWEMDPVAARDASLTTGIGSPFAAPIRQGESAPGTDTTGPTFSSWSGTMSPEPLESRATAFGGGNINSASAGRFDSSFSPAGQQSSFSAFDGEGSGFSSSFASDSRWSADWSSDSGWQGGMSEPERPAGRTAPAQAPSGGLHNNGWLADPGR